MIIRHKKGFLVSTIQHMEIESITEATNLQMNRMQKYIDQLMVAFNWIDWHRKGKR